MIPCNASRSLPKENTNDKRSQRHLVPTPEFRGDQDSTSRDHGSINACALNGYLIDQFLRDASNQRSDEYGGSVSNRLRFLREVVEAVTSTWPSDRTGARLSPTMNAHGMRDSNPGSLFIQAADMLSTYDLSYLHVAEAIRPGRLFNPDAPRVTPFIRQTYDGNLIANGGYDRQSAVAAIEALDADVIAFGQSFIANPDLPARFEANASLNSPDPATFYTPGPEGYTDYPIMTQVT